MLLSTVIIILREVLEGAILMSVMMALSYLSGVRLRWTPIALVTGIAGAFLYAANLETISVWFDYTGQEIVNATLHLAIVVLISIYVALSKINKYRGDNILTILMAAAVALTIVREGSEILLYYSGYLSNSETLVSVILGGVIGAGIGVSIGSLLYFSLTYFIPTYAVRTTSVLLALFSAGMLSHAVSMLTQADWLPAQHSLWDTSSILDERSIIGQLLYSITGYEATPTLLQVIAYLVGLVLVLVLPDAYAKFIGSAPDDKI